MPSSSPRGKYPNALTLKQAANWQCGSCGKDCRRHGEDVEDFANRMGYEVDDIKAHPRRWMLHVTGPHQGSQLDGPSRSENLAGGSVVLCGSCHRAYHNYRRRQQQQRRQQQRQERTGQLTLSDIRLPLAGVQLSLDKWVPPYEIVNPLPPQKRGK